MLLFDNKFYWALPTEIQNKNSKSSLIEAILLERPLRDYSKNGLKKQSNNSRNIRGDCEQDDLLFFRSLSTTTIDNRRKAFSDLFLFNLDRNKRQGQSRKNLGKKKKFGTFSFCL